MSAATRQSGVAGALGDPAAQGSSSVRMEWGPVGAAVVTEGCAFVVVVDVLSFTTTLSVACELGVDVIPTPFGDERADALAATHRARLARRRSGAGPGEVSLSPATIRAAGPMHRLVLPSPNGSAISSALAGPGTRRDGQVDTQVIGACLRNRTAVAAWLTERARNAPAPLRVAIVPAGERWPDGSLRPAIEDLWGAGAVISALVDHGWTGLSPEAHAAARCFDAVRDDLHATLHRCAGGVELHELGFAHDVDIAAELDHSTSTPLLVDGVYRAADKDPTTPRGTTDDGVVPSGTNTTTRSHASGQADGTGRANGIRSGITETTHRGDEATALRGLLRRQRDLVAWKLRGVADDTLAASSTPSGMTLHGLVHHLSAQERSWLVEVFAGHTGPDTTDTEWSPPSGSTMDDLLDAYAAQARRSDQVIHDAVDLDAVSAHRGMSLRWIVLHLIEETARHLGHIDVLRELADGGVGEEPDH